MSKINNKKPIEKLIHQGVHMLALKHNMDVDKISEIVKDWDDWTSANLVKKGVRKVTSKSGYYSTIIEMLAPVRFYWEEAGKFDGIEVGSSERGFSRYECGLLNRVFDVIKGHIVSGDDVGGDVPEAFRRALGDKG